HHMETIVTDYVRVVDRVSELGCLIPAGLAILPDNLPNAATRQDLRFSAEAATIRKLFRNSSFPVDDLLPVGERAASIHNKHFDWAPLLFISFGLLSENPHAVSIALGIISNYATDFFKGRPRHRVKLNVVVEKKNGDCKMLSFEGDVAGLTSLPEI